MNINKHFLKFQLLSISIDKTDVAAVNVKKERLKEENNLSVEELTLVISIQCPSLRK